MEELPVNTVKQFVVADSLHLIPLGVMKRMLTGWHSGSLGYDTKWSHKESLSISNTLKQIKMPKEFTRKVRGLDELSNWKGAEYQMFLHYLSITTLKDSLPEEYYQHFHLF